MSRGRGRQRRRERISIRCPAERGAQRGSIPQSLDHDLSLNQELEDHRGKEGSLKGEKSERR